MGVLALDVVHIACTVGILQKKKLSNDESSKLPRKIPKKAASDTLLRIANPKP